MTATIRIVGSRLTDGSRVHDVRLTVGEQTIKLHAISEKDAQVLSNALYDAIKAHALEAPEQAAGLY